MSRYPYLLLDADHTLFDFNRADRLAFSATSRYGGFPDTEEMYKAFSQINQGLWNQFDQGLVSKEFLVVERFARFLKAIGSDADPRGCNSVQLESLSHGSFLLPHAEEVCRTLAQAHQLYIVTNAVASVQKGRLSRSAIAPYIKAAFISEEAGAGKPDPAYFDYVFSRIDGMTRENCLVVGDSIATDIRGANNAGFPCCWFNPEGLTPPAGLRIDYTISDLRELCQIV